METIAKLRARGENARHDGIEDRDPERQRILEAYMRLQVPPPA